MNKALLQWVERNQDAQLVVSTADHTMVCVNDSAKWFLQNLGVDTKDSALPEELKDLFTRSTEELSSGKWVVEESSTFGQVTIAPFCGEQSHALISLHHPQMIYPGSHAVKVFENNVAGIYETTLDGEILAYNDAFCQLMGYSKAELAKLNGNELYVHEKDRAKFLRDLIKEGSVRNKEVRYQRKDESIAYCVENAYVIDYNGKQSIVGTLVDITQQKQFSDQFEALFYASADAVMLLDGKKVVRANKRACELYGLEKHDLVGLNVFDQKDGLFVLSPSEREYLDIKIDRMRMGEPQRSSVLSKRSDDSQFYAELNLSRLDEINPENIQLVVRDVSERVFYEEALKESEERFKLLSEVAIEGVVFVVDRKVRDCNKQFVELFGYKKQEEILGRDLLDFISESEWRRLEQTLSIRSLNRTEIYTSTRDGRHLILESTGSKIEFQNTDFSVFLFYDITARKRTEQALEQSTERFKSVVENSPNGIMILTDGEIKYVNSSGIKLFNGEDEDDLYGEKFTNFFDHEDALQIERDLQSVREGEDIELREYKIRRGDEELVLGLKATLSVYDYKPSIQVTLNNVTLRMKLMQETLRAQLAEEINVVLKREIEEHKRTQQKLREAEDFSRNIIESSIDMIIAVDRNSHIIEFNQAALQQFGYRSEEIMGESSENLYRNKTDFKRIQKELRSEEAFSGEIQMVSKSGKTFTSLLSASVMKNDEDETVGFMGVARDITELKKRERELRESEERYRDLFENASDLIFSIDADGRFIYANNSFLEAMESTREELDQMQLKEIVANDAISKCNDLVAAFGGQPLELDFISRSGNIIKVFGDSSIRYNEGQAESIRAIYRDITDLRRHEEVALKEGAKLESIFNSTENMMMWTMDVNGELTSFNQNFIRWTEHDFGASYAMGDNFLEALKGFTNPDSYQGQLKNFEAAVEGKARQFELPVLNEKDGELWLQVFINPVRIKNELAEVSCLAYDITDRKEIDLKIRNSLKEKEVLLQEVHHRVKNNLQVISSILNLQSSFVDDERTLELLEESQSRIKTMSYIHETLYQTSDFSSIEFTDYISSLARNLILSYSRSDVQVELDTKFDKIFLDLDQAIPCGLIINELVSNALKYAFPDRDKGTLTLNITEKEGKIAMLVADDGIGLPKDFKYEDSDSLGIYLVYALVEQLDAEIKIDSEAGTTFLITFEKR
ncbi:MAG: PAS domain S-box protein [Flavobacteriales bacterium]|nr:PAS domain S-box protein [Flavobacteriales bacterium]